MDHRNDGYRASGKDSEAPDGIALTEIQDNQHSTQGH